MVVTDNNTITAIVSDSEAGALETAVSEAESAQLIFAYGGAITNNETGAHTGPTEMPLDLILTGVEGPVDEPTTPVIDDEVIDDEVIDDEVIDDGVIDDEVIDDPVILFEVTTFPTQTQTMML